METLPNTTPISKVANNLDNLSPFEKYRVHIALEQNLILNLGLLKQLNPERIQKLDISEDAKIQLETLITKEQRSPSISSSYQCPFHFMQKRACTEGPADDMEDSEENEKNTNEEEDSCSDSEDSLDEYLKQWGVSFPKEKGGGGSCPFIFQRMMIERRKILDAQNSDEDQDSEGIEELRELDDEVKREAMEKCPHIVSKMTEKIKTKPEINGIFQKSLFSELKKEDLVKCPHFANLKSK